MKRENECHKLFGKVTESVNQFATDHGIPLQEVPFPAVRYISGKLASGLYSFLMGQWDIERAKKAADLISFNSNDKTFGMNLSGQWVAVASKEDMESCQRFVEQMLTKKELVDKRDALVQLKGLDNGVGGLIDAIQVSLALNKIKGTCEFCPD